MATNTADTTDGLLEAENTEILSNNLPTFDVLNFHVIAFPKLYDESLLHFLGLASQV